MTTSQPIACILYLVVESPQRKFRLILSNSVQVLWGSMVHCIRWVGMAKVTELISVRQLAIDKDLAFQPESLARTLSTMESKARLSLPSVMMGTPRYLPNSFVWFMPSSLSMATIFSALVWGEKKSFDLPWFTFWLEQLQKVSRTLLMVMLFFLVALAKRNKSSAEKRCVNEGPSLEVFTPVQFSGAI